MKNKTIVILIPVLNEEETIEIFYDAVSIAVKKVRGYSFFFHFIDDGSQDKTWKVLENLSEKNKNVSAIKLSRNFGSFVALFAGIETSYKKKSTDYIILTTVDLQNPPELIPKMVEKLKTGARIVLGVRTEREKGLSSVFSTIYWDMVRKFALPTVPKGGTDYCLIDRKVAGDIVASAEKNAHIFENILWLGYHQESVPYVRKTIVGRKSRWTLHKKIKLFIDTFVSFSYAPIWMVTYLGFGISALGFVYGLMILMRKTLYDVKIEGWSSLMLITLFLSGIQLIMLGVVAEYLWRTLDTSRKRPIYLVDKEIKAS